MFSCEGYPKTFRRAEGVSGSQDILGPSTETTEIAEKSQKKKWREKTKGVHSMGHHLHTDLNEFYLHSLRISSAPVLQSLDHPALPSFCPSCQEQTVWYSVDSGNIRGQEIRGDLWSNTAATDGFLSGLANSDCLTLVVAPLVTSSKIIDSDDPELWFTNIHHRHTG